MWFSTQTREYKGHFAAFQPPLDKVLQLSCRRVGISQQLLRTLCQLVELKHLEAWLACKQAVVGHSGQTGGRESVRSSNSGLSYNGRVVYDAGSLEHPVKMVQGYTARADLVGLADRLRHVGFRQHDGVAQLPA